MCPSPNCFKAFSPDCSGSRLACETTMSLRGSRIPRLAKCRRFSRCAGKRVIHGKNSLRQHGQGRTLGIPPLRAIDFLLR